jgi:glutamate---cysteine ligase / carboxylate-amine ligase
MDVNFGRSAPFSLGVEEEFQLLSPESFELVSRYDEIAEAAGSDERIKPELMQSVLEVATGISGTVGEAIEEARRLRARIRDAAAERELIFGLHVHVGLETADQAIAVANAFRTWLPELLALSANSPFWQARETGLASTRTKVFETFPRSGLPPAFGSFAEFERLVERGAGTNSFPDYTYIWWDLRPHPRLGTIEVRICDAQTRLESVAGIVALVQSLTAALADRYERHGAAALPVQPAPLIGENKWRAVRYGLAGDLIDLEHDTERPAGEAVAALVELASSSAERLGCRTELDEVEGIVRRGTGADEQGAVRAREGSLLAVVQWLAAQTVTGV